jgi:hypothetical protein
MMLLEEYRQKKREKDHYQKPISSRERRETEIFVSNPVINLEFVC